MHFFWPKRAIDKLLKSVNSSYCNIQILIIKGIEMHTRLGSGFSIIIVMFFAIFSNSTLATTINFDGTGAPSLFVQTSPLTNTYSGLGVNFNGVDGVGGSILNQSGNFGFNALSGTDFLAFNTAVGTGNIQRISFDSAVSNVSIWAAGSATSMRAFDSEGLLVSLSSK